MHAKAKSSPPLSVVRPNPNVVFRRLGDEIVLFHLETDHFYELNGTAARFWELMAEGHDDVGVRRRMLDEFAVDPDQLARETDDIIRSLLREDLITRGE